MFQRHKIFILLAFFCLLPPLIAGQISPYPQNDDALFIWSIKTLCDSGKLQFLATSPTCYLPVLLGSFAWKLFPGSYQVLHLLSIFFAFACGSAVYLILRHMSFRRTDAALVSSLIFVNPIIMNLAMSYMSDLPALAFFSWSCFFCLRAIQNRSPVRDWLACVATLIFSLACRQTAVFLITALAAICFLLILLRRRDAFLLAALLPVAIAAYYAGSEFVLANTIYSQPLLLYKEKLIAAAGFIFTSGLEGYRFCLLALAQISCYLGFYLLPLSLPMIFALFRQKKHLPVIAVAALGAVMLCAVPLLQALCRHQYMPYSFSIIFPPYAGNYSIFPDFIPGWKGEDCFWLTVFCDLAAIFFSFLFWLNCEIFCFSLAKGSWSTKSVAWTESGVEAIPNSGKRNLFFFFTALLFVQYTGLLILQTKVLNFDRYNISLLVPAIILASYSWRFFFSKALNRKFLFALLLLLFLYSTLASADFASFNRCRWQLTEALERAGVNPQDIDAGPEYNLLANPTLFGREKDYSENFIDEWYEKDRGGPEQSKYRWWPVTRTSYIVCNQDFEGYNKMSRARYWSFIEMRFKELCVLRKSPS